MDSCRTFTDRAGLVCLVVGAGVFARPWPGAAHEPQHSWVDVQPTLQGGLLQVLQRNAIHECLRCVNPVRDVKIGYCNRSGSVSVTEPVDHSVSGPYTYHTIT